MSEIPRSHKGLARELTLPVLALAQLRRAVEDRPSRRPLLSDLRESGSIEQDADVVIFIYRDDIYFSRDEWERRFPEKPYPKGIADLIVSKHRHGPTGERQLYFESRTVKFTNLAQPTTEPSLL
ncbi:MAG: DnaB-like helicase C-terminal domain-containing protein, partial [Dehalococcoidia bacterium]